MRQFTSNVREMPATINMFRCAHKAELFSPSRRTANWHLLAHVWCPPSKTPTTPWNLPSFLGHVSTSSKTSPSRPPDHPKHDKTLARAPYGSDPLPPSQFLPVSVPHALRPSVRDQDLHVPAVGGVVRHLRRQVLPESHALGVHPDLVESDWVKRDKTPPGV